MATFGASLAEAMTSNFRGMTKAAAGEDAGAAQMKRKKNDFR
jgi:hypothetical protein